VNIVEKARVFATAAHAAVGQVRKYTFEPYIVHPTEVASIVASVPHTREMLAAAYLHDTVEDTGVTLDLIRAEFGDEIADLVGWLTDVSQPADGNRVSRKAKDRAHSAEAPANAQTVKLADLIANTRSIVQHDEKFAQTYLEEKRLLLAVMDKGDPQLMAEARKYIGD
jgi:(p)ppGpp synthase/HD superfamily hydrolase